MNTPAASFVPRNRFTNDPKQARNATSSRFDLLTDQRVFVAKPTAYAPFGNQEDNPLEAAQSQLHARLNALREVRSRLHFVATSYSQHPSLRHRISSISDDVDMTEAAPSPRQQLQRSNSLDIVTRVAVASDDSADTWMEEGGIIAMDGLESLFLRFLSPQELTVAGSVCQSWYAISRRNELWEPLLFTPLEKYPLRQFLGFNTTGFPAMQVYVVYRKLRWNFRYFDPKKGTPTQRRHQPLRRRENQRHADANENNQLTDANADEDTVDWPRERGCKSVHLAWNVRPDTREQERHPLALRQDGGVDLANLLQVRRRRQLQQQVFDANNNNNNDDDNNDDINDDHDQFHDQDIDHLPLLFEATETTPVPATTPVIESVQRTRLRAWLTANKGIEHTVFRSFARQLLLALVALDAEQLAHSDICMSNIYVVERSAGAPANEVVAAISLDHHSVIAPLFQLYCHRGVNVTPTLRQRNANEANETNANQTHQPQHQQPRTRAMGMLHDYHQRILQARARLNLNINLLAAPPRLPLPPMPPAPPPPLPNVQEAATVKAYLRLLRDVWCHSGVATTADRAAPIFMLLFTRPGLCECDGFKGLLEYGEFLLSRHEASLQSLFQHAFFHDHDANLPQLVGVSPVNPAVYGSADEYRTNAFAWHANFLHHRPTPTGGHHQLQLQPKPTSWSAPTTSLGPAFFHDALQVAKLRYQRLESVIAPATATSEWVRALATSQRFTLRQLDLSFVSLPLSVLLCELHQLTRVTHLRLPREILRDDNMEQFVAAVACSRLLPALEVMDDAIRVAMDRLEAAYVSQLRIMGSLADMPKRGPPPALHHTFSSPF